MTTDWIALAVTTVVGVLATARATRLLAHDDWPPAVALRRWWFNQTVAKGGKRAGWASLLTNDEGGSGCPFCLAPWLMLVNLAWAVWARPDLGVLGEFTWSDVWWFANAWFALSYLTSMVVVRDEPPE